MKPQLEGIKLRISQASEQSGRRPEDVKLVAVCKTFPPEAVLEAYNAGQRMFGENRVQEMFSKAGILPPDIEWHLIGHLQGNKAVNAVRTAKMIHAVDSEDLIARINRIALASGNKQEILLEINISGEESKFGLGNEAQIMKCAEAALKSTNVELRGLMTMAPYEAPEIELRKIFSGLRELRNKIETAYSARLPELSMGMSGDYEAAIAEGATIVRIGTAIFGKRTKNAN
ncbi:MAG: YggS family pyridoxal phosphate enzyme [Lentisphaerae bacterium GWF2_50_93]|nr:MAG: YggS family pyridoxal phosphate enzyme [Lentisphaerae bacterium GWF2_50_93]